MVAVQLSQIVVVTINLIFMIFGLAALIVGIIFKVGWDEVQEVFAGKAADVNINLEDAGDTLAYASIIFGAFIILVSIFGCIGACCKVRVLLMIYAIVLLLLIIGQIVAVALFATYTDDASDKIKKVLKEQLKDYNEEGTDAKSKAFSALFNTLECCGVENITEDFPDRKKFYGRNRPGTLRDIDYDIPITCCKSFDYERNATETIYMKHTLCLNKGTRRAANAYLEGCESKIENFIDDNKVIFIAVGATILALELIMTILACFLFCRHDDD